MKRFILLAALAGLCVGCHGKNQHAPFIPYVLGLNVQIADNNDTTAIIEIDSRLFGVLQLLLGDESISIDIVLSSGDIDLGVLPAGHYKLILDGYGNNDHQLKDSVNVEFDIVSNEPPPPPPPPPPPSVDPSITCNANEEGGAAVVVDTGTFSGPFTLRRLDDPDDIVLVTNGDAVVEVPLGRANEDREYVFVLYNADGVEVARCEVLIPKHDDGGDDGDDPHFDPCDLNHDGEVSDCERVLCQLDHHKKYIVRHKDGKGRVHQIIVDWHALLTHICKHGDELGCAVNHKD